MIQENNDVYKEVFTILSFFSNDLIDKIPSTVLETIGNLSLNSNANFYIDKEKSLKDQNISDDSKNLISLIYYSYIASENEKNELLKLWNNNENKHQKDLREKYNPNNIFKKNNQMQDIIQDNMSSEVISDNVAMMTYKESVFKKIINKIKSIFHIQ